jgi:hypothetical protein
MIFQPDEEHVFNKNLMRLLPVLVGTVNLPCRKSHQNVQIRTNWKWKERDEEGGTSREGRVEKREER